jgi:hypothetical protein
MSRIIVLVLFFVLVFSGVVFCDDSPVQDLPFESLALLDRQCIILQELNAVSTYQLGLLSFLSGVVLAFVFLYGLRLR